MNGQGNAVIGALVGIIGVIIIALFSILLFFPALKEAGVNIPSSSIIAFILVIIAAVVVLFSVLLRREE